MNDTRFQLVLDDIDAATIHRKAGRARCANAAIDDARTRLQDIAEECPTPPKLLAMTHLGLDTLHQAIGASDCVLLKCAHIIVKCASEVPNA